MRAALFNDAGVAAALMTGSAEAIRRTAEHHGYDWRELEAEFTSLDDVPHLSTFPPRD